LLLRFALPLTADETVLEAYLLLDRVPDVDADPEPVDLTTAAIASPWAGRSLTWAGQPRIEDVRSPVTQVRPAGGSPVRLDVRAIVERWRRRSPGDLGIAVVRAGAGVAAVAGAARLAFAIEPRGSRGAWQDGPRLELYVKR
jgi:hypothetical protein